MKTLFLIPARGGSKGIPKKNIKLLGGVPLIHYSIASARTIASDSDICVSTDDLEIIEKVNDVNLSVPFRRPDELASDTAGTYEVIIHALDYYRNKGIEYDAVMLLQPTSPFRKKEHLQEILSAFNLADDMIVSVVDTPHANPYFSLFEENDGLLTLSKQSNFFRRQDCPRVYAFNGSIYLINVKSLRTNHIRNFNRIRKYVMEDVYSVDIDKELDWLFAETILKNAFLQ